MKTPKSGYSIGKTPSFICQRQRCFSYCLYVPRKSAPSSVLVAMHDTMRNNQSLRDLFTDYAEASSTLVIAPLFPGGVGSPNDLDDYKYLRAGGVSYDQVLLQIVEEVAERYSVNTERFALFGFSGGAHFVHRFLYLWPERLKTAIVASPGSVTLPDERMGWWAGLADFKQRFGRDVNWEALRLVHVHLLVGACDTDASGTIRSTDHPQWVEGADTAGSNRVERLRSLRDYLARAGVQASYAEIPDVGHEVGPIVGAAIRYLEGKAQHPA